jgi:predicted nucleotidyltransferase
MPDEKISLPEHLLTECEYQALQEIKSTISQIFEIEQVVLFGSVVRGEADEESDVDVLFVTKRLLSRWERHQITDAVCDINLEFGTSFSTLVVDSKSWHHGPLSLLNIHHEIQREGVPV